MTLEEYYIEWQKVQIPDELQGLERREWVVAERKKLQSQLSEGDLEIVLSRQRDWQRKMQSSVG